MVSAVGEVQAHPVADDVVVARGGEARPDIADAIGSLRHPRTRLVRLVKRAFPAQSRSCLRSSKNGQSTSRAVVLPVPLGPRTRADPIRLVTRDRHSAIRSKVRRRSGASVHRTVPPCPCAPHRRDRLSQRHCPLFRYSVVLLATSGARTGASHRSMAGEKAQRSPPMGRTRSSPVNRTRTSPNRRPVWIRLELLASTRLNPSTAPRPTRPAGPPPPPLRPGASPLLGCRQPRAHDVPSRRPAVQREPPSLQRGSEAGPTATRVGRRPRGPRGSSFAASFHVEPNASASGSPSSRSCREEPIGLSLAVVAGIGDGVVDQSPTHGHCSAR